MFRLYGKLPNRKDLLGNKLKVGALWLFFSWLHILIWAFIRQAGAQILRLG